MAPWFRWMAAHAPDLDVTVLFAVEPTAAAQAAGFGGQFQWSLPLREGYASRVLSPSPYDGPLDGTAFAPIPAPGLEAALAGIRPDAVVVPGWHARAYREAVEICRRRGWPVIYRGDSTRASGRRGPVRLARRTITRRRLSRFDAFLAVGTRSRDYLLAHGAVDPLIFASPHAVDNTFFAGLAATQTARPIAPTSGRGSACARSPGRLMARCSRSSGCSTSSARRGCSRRRNCSSPGATADEDCRREAAAGVSAVFGDSSSRRRWPRPMPPLTCWRASDAGDCRQQVLAWMPRRRQRRGRLVPDLVSEDTGAAFAGGDVEALASALRGVLDGVARGTIMPRPAARAARHGFRGHGRDAIGARPPVAPARPGRRRAIL